jgi:hypothetical protein
MNQRKRPRIEHATAVLDMHGLTHAICVCGWTRSMSNSHRCEVLAAMHITVGQGAK